MGEQKRFECVVRWKIVATGLRSCGRAGADDTNEHFDQAYRWEGK